jgi:HlyD family secretion protein
LNLTPEQQAKADAIIQASRQEIQETRKNAKPEEAGTKNQNLIKQKIMAILTPEQKQKLAESVSSSETDQKRQARVWTLSPEGNPVPVSVVLGITDGTFSAVISGDLKEGAEVIVGEMTTGNAQNRGTPSPLMGGGPGR